MTDAILREAKETWHICKFTIASNQKYANTEKVYFIDCDYFGKIGRCDKLVDYLTKGSLVVVTG